MPVSNDDSSGPSIPYSDKKPERFKTAKQRAEDKNRPDHYEQGEPAYYQRPIRRGFDHIKKARG